MRLLLLPAVVTVIGFVIGGWRSAAIGLIAFTLGFLSQRYLNRSWPWRFSK